ncbi:hypothetical protein A2U01_0054078, partial [Trifolium medium]|nr:hypothetical protein [Trifolium medium]
KKMLTMPSFSDHQEAEQEEAVRRREEGTSSEMKTEHELLKEEVKSISETQHHVIQNQEDMSSKLDAILAYISRQT